MFQEPDAVPFDFALRFPRAGLSGSLHRPYAPLQHVRVEELVVQFWADLLVLVVPVYEVYPTQTTIAANLNSLCDGVLLFEGGLRQTRQIQLQFIPAGLELYPHATDHASRVLPLRFGVRELKVMLAILIVGHLGHKFSYHIGSLGIRFKHFFYFF